QVPPVATVTAPVRETNPASAHMVRSGPALTVAAAVKVKVTLSETGLHSPLPVDVQVSVTLPLVRSFADGVYRAFRSEVSEKVPSPPVQPPPVAIITAPLRGIAPISAHTDLSSPASATGAGVMVSVI